MNNEVLIYGTIWSYGAESFVKQVNSLVNGEELIVRINSEGGTVTQGWGMIAKFKEFEGPKKIKVDGMAYSMAAMWLCYSDKVEAIDTSEFMFHRAAYPGWYERDMDDSVRGNLKRINQSLRSAMEAKMNIEKFTEITGVNLDDLFSMEARKDVYLTAQQALEVGLIDKIVQLTPERKAEINIAAEKMQQVESRLQVAADAAMIWNAPAPENKPEPQKKQIQKPKNKMTISDLKAQHPELVEAISKEAVANERDRVGAWLTFQDVDSKAVKEGIQGGAQMSQTQMVELSRKSLQAEHLTSLGGDDKTVDAKKKSIDAPKTEAEATAKAVLEAVKSNPKND